MSARCSPDAREQTTKEESAVSLDERGEEGEDAVYGERDEQSLASSDPVGQPPPHKGAHHHTQVDNEAWIKGRGRTMADRQGQFSHKEATEKNRRHVL